jgi:hypothetical protein
MSRLLRLRQMPDVARQARDDSWSRGAMMSSIRRYPTSRSHDVQNAKDEEGRGRWR